MSLFIDSVSVCVANGHQAACFYICCSLETEGSVFVRGAAATQKPLFGVSIKGLIIGLSVIIYAF